MVGCSIIGCKSRSEQQIPGLTFHAFPVEPNVRSLWVEATGRSDWQPKGSAKVCSLHFEDASFIITKWRTYLKPGTIPEKQSHIKEIPFDSSTVSVQTIVKRKADYFLQDRRQPKKACLDTAASGSECDQELVIIPKGEEMIVRVYRYLQSEYEQMEHWTGRSCDLSPLANILKRTAAATGVSEHTVTSLLQHDQRPDEETSDAETSDVETSDAETSDDDEQTDAKRLRLDIDVEDDLDQKEDIERLWNMEQYETTREQEHHGQNEQDATKTLIKREHDYENMELNTLEKTPQEQTEPEQTPQEQNRATEEQKQCEVRKKQEKDDEEEKRKELQRKKASARQRAYYQRQKALKKKAGIKKETEPKSNAERQRGIEHNTLEESPQEQTEPEQTPQEQTEPEQTPQEQTEPEQTPQEQTEPEQTPQEQTEPEQTPQEQTEPEQTPQEQNRATGEQKQCGVRIKQEKDDEGIEHNTLEQTPQEQNSATEEQKQSEVRIKQEKDDENIEHNTLEQTPQEQTEPELTPQEQNRATEEQKQCGVRIKQEKDDEVSGPSGDMLVASEPVAVKNEPD